MPPLGDGPDKGSYKVGAIVPPSKMPPFTVNCKTDNDRYASDFAKFFTAS